MKYAIADLATEATQQAIAEHLRELHDSDITQVIDITWWRGDEELVTHVVPAHLAYDVLPAVPGATHLTIEERTL